MNNKQVAENWRAQTKSEGHSMNMFFEHDAIYSYGYHFPMALMTNKLYNGRAIILQNSDGYSNSTAKHLNYMRQECHGDAVIEMPTEVLKEALNYFRDNGNGTIGGLKVRIEKHLSNVISEAVEKRDRARTRKEMHQYTIDKASEQLEVLKHLG